MANESSFREKPVYPVLFILVLSVVFVGILAVMFRSNEPRIDRQKDEAYQKTILSLCADSLASLSGKSAAEIEAAFPQSYTQYIGDELPEGTFVRKAFEVKFEKSPIAYVFDVAGKGLWGSMRALVATTLDQQTLLGVYVYEQVETPGLGGRIEEAWFRNQFKNKRILGADGPLELELVPEGQSEIGPSQVRQITGATITSNAVINMLRDELKQIASPEVSK